MKKTKLILWIIGALFFISSIPLFTEGNLAAGVCGVVIAAALFFIGYRKGAASEEQSGQAAPPPKPSENGVYRVYVEKGGKRYHYNDTCSGMKKPQYIPLKDAVKMGYTECKKCSR